MKQEKCASISILLRWEVLNLKQAYTHYCILGNQGYHTLYPYLTIPFTLMLPGYADPPGGSIPFTAKRVGLHRLNFQQEKDLCQNKGW